MRQAYRAVGVDAKNSSGQKVNRDGTVISTAGYSWVVNVNPELPPQGSSDPHAAWGEQDEITKRTATSKKSADRSLYS